MDGLKVEENKRETLYENKIENKNKSGDELVDKRLNGGFVGDLHLLDLKDKSLNGIDQEQENEEEFEA